MPIEKIDKPKKKPNPLSLSLSEKERQELEDFAEEYNYNTLARLIKESLYVVMRNPALLDPTKNRTYNSVKESLREFYKKSDNSINNSLEEISSRLYSLERFQEYTAKKLGASNKDLKKLQEKDTSGDEIFSD